MNPMLTGEPLLANAYAVCYTGNQRRASLLKAEMERVGLPDFTAMWSFPSPYRDFLLSKIPHEPHLAKRPGTWGATLGHYFVLKTAYELGLPYVFIVEDDCRFLKDLSAVKATLGDVPADWDMLMLDHLSDRNVSPCGKEHWRKCTATWSTACYIANRKAMERLILMYESPVSGKYRHPVMRFSDHWTDTKYLGADCNIYCAYPNLAIQCDCGDGSNCSPGQEPLQHKYYREAGVKFSDYAPYSEDVGSEETSPDISNPVPLNISAPAALPALPVAHSESESSYGTIRPNTPVSQSVGGPVDVLYVLGKGASTMDNQPLRWSLRSLQKHAKNIGRVIVVGFPPQWLSDKVVKIPVQDKTSGKQWNILNCIAEGIKGAGLYKPFLYSSDDHYLCQDADLTKWPRLERGVLLSFPNYVRRKGHAPGTYQKSLCDTHKCLSAEGLSVRKACLHFNTWMDGRYLDEVMSLAERHKSFTRFGFEPTCLFNAIFEKNHPNAVYKVITNQDDRKIRIASDIDAKLREKALGFSTTPEAETNAKVIARMNELYPDKSQWES